DPEQPPPPHPRPFGLDDVSNPGLAAWAVGCDDIDAAVRTCRAHGYDPGEVIDMERRRPDGTVLRWRLTRRAPGAGLVPFLIDWLGSEPPSRSGPQGLVLDRLEVELPDPDRLSSIVRALEVDVTVTAASRARISAHVRGPNGEIALD